MTNKPIMIDDSELDIIIYSTVCTLCKHYDVGNIKKNTCKAFPKGIPLQIWNGENKHTKPFKGDGGIRFEPV